MNARTYRGLLIANSTFPSDPHNLPNLEGPRNDAALLRDALCDREYGLFAADNVRLVQERGMADVLREIEDFLRSASRQDTLLLYYSGHGVLDQSNEFFLCAHNTRSDRLRSTAVKASDVREMIDESAAQTTLIFLDCCHSGRFKGGDVPATLEGRGRFVVTSSRSGELANDAHALNHASLFTHHLVEGLRGSAVDHDHDGVVNLSELYDYVHDALGREGKQVPQKRFEGSGEIPIALRPAAIEEPAPAGLVAPAATMPILDVSDTVIDLGEVGADETLPPERILVINRGGGTLDWTVQSSADWVHAVPGETGVELRLRPAVGPNRANIYITDTKTGLLKTVRVRVRVRPALAGTPSGEVPVVPAPEADRPADQRPLVPPSLTPRAPAAPPEARPPAEPGAASEPTGRVPVIAPLEAPVVEAPVASAAAPGGEAPVAEAPIAAAPVVAAPVAEAPVVEAPVADEPLGPPSTPPAPAVPAPRAESGGWRSAHLVSWLAFGTLALAIVAALWYVWSAGSFLEEVQENDSSAGLILRREWGVGLAESWIVAVVMGVAALVNLARRRRRPELLAALGVMALALALLRTIERAQHHESWGWMASWGGFGAPVALCVVVAVLAAVAVYAGGGAVRRPSPPDRRGSLALGLVLLWAISLGQDLYDHADGFSFGDHTQDRGDGRSWQLTTVVVLVLLVGVAVTCLGKAVARGVLLGTAGVALATAAAEIAFTAVEWDPDAFTAWRLPILVVPALAVAVVAIRGFRAERSAATAPMSAFTSG